MAPRPIPEGHHTATPYLIVKGAAQALEFYKKAFGARETRSISTHVEDVSLEEMQRRAKAQTDKY